jgi:hypothetical protein
MLAVSALMVDRRDTCAILDGALAQLALGDAAPRGLHGERPDEERPGGC